MNRYLKWVRPVVKAALLSSIATAVFATESDKTTMGTVAGNVEQSVSAFKTLIQSLGYVAGLGFFVAGVFKFKQHRDNPTQIPVGTPIAMLCVSAALVFMPQMLTVSRDTMGVKGDAAMPS